MVTIKEYSLCRAAQRHATSLPRFFLHVHDNAALLILRFLSFEAFWQKCICFDYPNLQYLYYGSVGRHDLVAKFDGSKTKIDARIYREGVYHYQATDGTGVHVLLLTR